MRYRIKNWREYQHYKGRCPPWIKFHSHTFTSKDWTTLADACKLSMLVCMVVASMDKEGDGSFDGDPDYLKRVAYLDEAPDLAPLVESGFLVVASTCKQTQAKDIPSVSLSVSDLPLSLEEEESVREGETAKVEDFIGPMRSDPPAFPDPLEDFEPEVAEKARHFWSLFCAQYHGKRAILRNLHLESTHKELRHFAKAIDLGKGRAIRILTEYYNAPPKEDKGLNAYSIVSKLGLVATAPAPWEATKQKNDEDAKERLRRAIRGESA